MTVNEIVAELQKVIDAGNGDGYVSIVHGGIFRPIDTVDVDNGAVFLNDLDR